MIKLLLIAALISSGFDELIKNGPTSSRAIHTQWNFNFSLVDNIYGGKQRHQNKAAAKFVIKNKDCLEPCHPSQSFGGAIHTFLSDKIPLLPLTSLFFAGLAGVGGFWGFNDFDGNRKRQRLGKFLFFIGGTIGFLLASTPLLYLLTMP